MPIGKYNRMTRLVNTWREKARKLSNDEKPLTAPNVFKALMLAQCANELEEAINEEKLAVEVHA